MPDTALDVERLATYFVNYMFKTERGAHVRRVATWLGFIVKAIERASGGRLERRHIRQAAFKYRRHKFKVRYKHRLEGGGRGGIEIVEYDGTGDIDTAVTILNLSQAEDVYKSLEEKLDKYLEWYDKPLPRIRPK